MMTVSHIEIPVEQQKKEEEKPKKKTPNKNRRGGMYNRYHSGRHTSYYNESYSYVYYYPPSMYYPAASFNNNKSQTTRDDEDLEIIMHDESTTTQTSSDQSQLLDLKKQLEYYFSRQNLVNDTFLVSQMDSDLYVPISLIASFKRVREWTTDINVIVNTLRESTLVIVDETGTKVKPNISLERNTVILRDVPDCTEEEIINYLKEIDITSVQSMRKDIGNLWYFTFDTEEEALRLFNNVKRKPFKNQTIAARMKSEPALRVQGRTPSLYSPSDPSVFHIYPMSAYYYPYQHTIRRQRYPNKQHDNTRQYAQGNTSRSTRGGYKSTSDETRDKRDDIQTLEQGMAEMTLQKTRDRKQQKQKDYPRKTEKKKTKRKGKHGQDKLKPTHFPPLPNQQDTDLESQEKAFPSLCQTNQAKVINSSTYADILKENLK